MLVYSKDVCVYVYVSKKLVMLCVLLLLLCGFAIQYVVVNTSLTPTRIINLQFVTTNLTSSKDQ